MPRISALKSYRNGHSTYVLNICFTKITFEHISECGRSLLRYHVLDVNDYFNGLNINLASSICNDHDDIERSTHAECLNAIRKTIPLVM